MGCVLTWFQIWTICWQTAIVLTPLVLGVAILWLNSRYSTKSDLRVEGNRLEARQNTDRAYFEGLVKNHAERIQDHETRLQLAEKDIARPPSRHQLNNAISVLQGSMHAIERGFDDMRRSIETQNSYVHTIIEQHMKEGAR